MKAPRWKRVSRDAEHPAKGEIYESGHGSRWEVVDVIKDGKQVEVKRVERRSGRKWGHAADSGDTYVQDSGRFLKGMRLVKGQEKQLSLFGGDPSGRAWKRTQRDLPPYEKSVALKIDAGPKHSLSPHGLSSHEQVVAARLTQRGILRFVRGRYVLTGSGSWAVGTFREDPSHREKKTRRDSWGTKKEASLVLAQGLRHKYPLIWSAGGFPNDWNPRVEVREIHGNYFVFVGGEVKEAFRSAKAAVKKARGFARRLKKEPVWGRRELMVGRDKRAKRAKRARRWR